MSEISAYRDGYTLGQHSMRTAAYEWGFEKGVDTERERIINLIENHHSNWSFQQGNGHLRRCETCEVIELIKGENK